MEAVLEVKDLCKTYEVKNIQNHVLRNMNFSLSEGEFVAVMGQSGAGKSTLLYTVSGMDTMTAGEVFFDGESLSGLSDNEMADLRLEKMGFIFQHMHLLKNLCVYDNIILPGYMLGKAERREVNAYARELMNMTNISKHSTQDINQISGGQLQRACICRALINRPKVLFADEPTGSLHSKAADEVMGVFCRVNREGTGIMMVTHDTKVASYADRIIYVLDGAVKDELTLGKFDPAQYKNSREKKVCKWLLEMDW